MKTKEEWIETISEEIPYIDVKPYSHNIISVALQAIAKQFGVEEANKVIDDFDLEPYGWSKVQSIESKKIIDKIIHKSTGGN